MEALSNPLLCKIEVSTRFSGAQLSSNQNDMYQIKVELSKNPGQMQKKHLKKLSFFGP